MPKDNAAFFLSVQQKATQFYICSILALALTVALLNDKFGSLIESIAMSASLPLFSIVAK
jgi:hypothetical protein